MAEIITYIANDNPTAAISVRQRIEEAARSLSAHPEMGRQGRITHLGDLDRVLMDDASNLVTGFVVRHGVLFPHDTVLPVRYVGDLIDDLIHVDIPEAEWESLEEYAVE